MHRKPAEFIKIAACNYPFRMTFFQVLISSQWFFPFLLWFDTHSFPASESQTVPRLLCMCVYDSHVNGHRTRDSFAVMNLMHIIGCRSTSRLFVKTIFVYSTINWKKFDFTTILLCKASLKLESTLIHDVKCK